MLALLILICFTTDQLAYGYPAIQGASPPLPFKPSKLQANIHSLLSSQLPKSVGAVKKRFRGRKNQIIIHIQDAHVNEEAQRSIASILEFLSQNHGVYPIYLEGAAGELSHRPLSLYPEKRAKELTADFFLREGRLSGAEYYALTQCPECHLIGAEDKGWYEENRRAYLKAIKTKETLQPVLSKLRATLEKLSFYVFTEEFQKWKRMRGGFYQDGNHFLPYLRFLYGFTRKHTAVKRFPKVRSILRGQKPDADLFREIEKMEEVLKEELLRDAPQKDLAHFFEILETYEKLINFSLTREDAEFYYLNRQFFSSEKISRFLGPLFRRYRFSLNPEELSLELLDESINEFEKFYALALKRDELMARFVLKDMKKRGENISVFLTGGFHTPGLSRIFETEGVSYLVLMPQMASMPDARAEGERYDRAMSNTSSILNHLKREPFSKSAQPRLVSDPRYQLQPPRVLPSMRDLQFASQKMPGEPSLRHLLQRFPDFDFFILEMIATAIQDVRLNGPRTEAISNFLAHDLTGSEKWLADLIYRPVHDPGALYQKGKDDRGAYLSKDGFKDSSAAISAKWSPSLSAAPEGKSFQNPEFIGFKTKDNVFTQIHLITDTDAYSIAETHLLQELKRKPRSLKPKSRSRSELRCGNEGVLVERQGSDREILPSSIQDFLEAMGRITKVRGEQAAGRAMLVQKGEEVGVLRERVINSKRKDLAAVLRRAFNLKMIRSVLFRKIRPARKTYLVMEHYRYGTSSAPAIQETHPHQWMPERAVQRWMIQDGKWQLVEKRLANLISHNGDFDYWNIFGQNQPFEHIGLWLERVLHTPNSTAGDSPKIAGMMDLLLTQGMWDASARLAFQLEVASSLRDAFGGEVPSKEAPSTAPDLVLIRRWAGMFEKVFKKYQNMLLLGEVINFSDISETGRQIFHQALFNVFSDEPTMKDWSKEKKKQFIVTAAHLFFENDLYHATRMFMSRAKGSFGLATVSTFNPDQVVLSAYGQPISVGFHPQAKMAAYASEAAALKVPFGKAGVIPYRFDLNQVGGEIAEVSVGKVRIYSQEKGRELSEDEISRSGRMIEVRDNPFISALSENVSEDIVAGDIRDIPKVLSGIREDWQNPDSFNYSTAQAFSKFVIEKARKAERNAEEGSSGELDILVTGVEVSQWIGEQFAEDLKQIFPKLRIGSLSANKILKDIHRKKTPYVGKDTLVLVISQSGQTFPTLNAAIALNALHNLQDRSQRKVFVVTGELDSLMGGAVEQHYYKDAEFSQRIFTNGSGRRPAEPSTVAAAAAYQTLTELLLFLARRVRQTFPNDLPLGMTLQTKDIRELQRLRDSLIDRGIPAITGSTTRGDKIDSVENKKLITLGEKWGRHVLEPAVAWGLSAMYVAVTVIFGMPLFSTLAQFLIAWASLEDFRTFILYTGRAFDALLYIFLPFVITLGLRWAQSRTLFARMGKRTLVIGDVSYVHQLLESYASKLFSLSYAIASVDVHGANPGDHMLHRFGHRVTRGTLALLGRPDGRLASYENAENAVLMTGKQAKGVQNYKTGAEIITIGHNPSGNPNAQDEASVLWTHTVPKAKLIQELYENRFASFERLIAGYVLLHAMAKKVSGFRPLRYDMSRSQSGTRIATTASPVSSADLFSGEMLHLKNGQLIDRAADLPFQVAASADMKILSAPRSFSDNGKKESEEAVSSPRSEVRLVPARLFEALDEKTRFERTTFLNQRLRLLKKARGLEEKGFNIEQALLNAYPVISSDTGELILNYHARRHSGEFMKRFYGHIKEISKKIPVYVFRDPETPLSNWNQIKSFAPAGVPIRFVNHSMYPRLERFVAYRRKMKKADSSEILQLLDESRIFRSAEERRWNEAALLGATALGQNTIVILGANQTLSPARHLRVWDMIDNALKSAQLAGRSA